MSYDRENLWQFKCITRQINRQVKPCPCAQVTSQDFMVCEEFLRHSGSTGKREAKKDERLWRLFRQQVARLFKQMHHIRRTFEWQIDWTAAYEWLVNNWTKILKILATLLLAVV